MCTYIIKGGRKLCGEVTVSGSKNASLPILAASILNNNETKLYNVPKIKDIDVMLKIMQILGCNIKVNSGKISINSKQMKYYEIPKNLMSEMRSSVILAGALISRFKKAIFSYPGGCEIGARPIDLHLKAFKKLGIDVFEDNDKIICTCDKVVGDYIKLDFPSVGATENIMLVSVFAEGITYIENAAKEPEIIDLEKFLNRMGAKISGAGTGIIKIIGVQRLKDVGYNIMPDRIEAGTLLCATAATKGNIILNNVVPEHIDIVLQKLEECGCKIEKEKRKIYLEAPKRLKAIKIETNPYPNFPTDMQAIFGSMLTKAKGTTEIYENIFESRYKYAEELKKIGAKISINNRCIRIKGIRTLKGNTMKATDLRGGAAVVIGGLMARGKSKIENIEYILRGYEKLDKKLNDLGARVQIK